MAFFRNAFKQVQQLVHGNTADPSPKASATGDNSTRGRAGTREKDGRISSQPANTGEPKAGTASFAKVVVVGDRGVGKTQLVSWFARKEYDEDYSPTVGVEFSEARCLINGHVWNLQLWDAAGKSDYQIEQKIFYEAVAVAILVLDLTSEDPGSLDSAKRLLKEIRSNSTPDLPVLIVGTKCDEPRKLNKDGVVELITSSPNLSYLELAPRRGADDDLRAAAISLMVQNVSSCRVREEY